MKNKPVCRMLAVTSLLCLTTPCCKGAYLAEEVALSRLKRDMLEAAQNGSAKDREAVREMVHIIDTTKLELSYLDTIKRLLYSIEKGKKQDAWRGVVVKTRLTPFCERIETSVTRIGELLRSVESPALVSLGKQLMSELRKLPSIKRRPPFAEAGTSRR